MATRSPRTPASPPPVAPRRRPKATPGAAPKAVSGMDEAGLIDQMRGMAGKVLDIGVATAGAAKSLGAAADIARALLPGIAEPGVWSQAGAALRRLRKAAGLTVAEVGAAIDLNDPSLVEAWEKGRIAVPFELVLRLAAVLGRNDPVGFVMKFTRTTNPALWRALEELGVGRLLIQSAREREFANIYRAEDAARSLSDAEFADVLAFTRAAFEMAMAFRARGAAGHRAKADPRSD